MTRILKKIWNDGKNLSWNLFAVMLFWCVLGVLGVFVSWMLWSQVGLTDSASHVTASLAVVGGVGGVVALVIAFRKQSAAERGEGQDRLNDAVRLLGDSQPSTRIAGVYAVIATGKRHTDLREQAADILCGYLRTTRPADDSPVESTIIHRLQDVLRKDNPDRWQHIDIDVHGAAITEPFELTNSVIATVDFSHTTFNEQVNLDGAEFENFALFQNTTFKAYVSIAKSTFQDGANFSRSEFYDGVHFTDSEFLVRKPAPKMDNADQGPANIDHPTLFNAVHFHSIAYFNSVRFVTDCDFSGLSRYQPAGDESKTDLTSFDVVTFLRTKFLARAYFRGVEVTQEIHTERVEFKSTRDKQVFDKIVAEARQ